jgi:hypothetical protein
MSMTILHVVDFCALCAVILLLCEELRKLDGRRHPVIALLVIIVATLAFLCATHDLAGAPLGWGNVAIDTLAAALLWLYFSMRKPA